MVGRVSARAFESLPESELLGTNQDDKKVGKICETVKKYHLMKISKTDSLRTGLIHNNSKVISPVGNIGTILLLLNTIN